MKYIFLVYFSIALVIAGFSNNISEHDVRIVALNWINTIRLNEYSEFDIECIHTRTVNEKVSFYIVSFNPKGWVMVSGSGTTEPVIAYSADTRFDIESMPIQLSEWLDGIESEINHSRDAQYSPSTNSISKWEMLLDENFSSSPLKSATAVPVGPLLTSKWNQGRYYNELAPADASSIAGNGHVWIGCVATAMAKVMKYWEYPHTGMGSHSYQHANYGTLSANFGNTSYNWSNMPNVVNQQNIDVQTISYHAAVSVNMIFGPYGSGAYLDDARDAMFNYFKYNTSVFESLKNRWDEDEWKLLLRDELNKGKPVIYAGYNITGSSGHAFVCDGYEGDFFHFNWGWGGTANGYYLLSLLNPSGSNYSFNQSALFGIEPVISKNISTPMLESFETGYGQFSLSGIATVTNTEQHSGNSSLRLSKPSFSSNSLNVATLTFLVPSDGQLSFWVKRFTPDVSANNTQKVLLMPQYGSTPLIEFFNGDYNDSDWVNYTSDLTAYAGQIVRLMFKQQNFDHYREQWMFVDDVVITGVNQNLPPFEPQTPNPTNDAVAISFSPTLRWAGGDPNGDNVTYSVYFGTSQNPPFLANVTTNSYKVEGLSHLTTYYWRIVSNDGYLQTDGPVWSFTTQGIPPSVGSCGIVDITASSAGVCGEIISDNGKDIMQRGIAWARHPEPSVYDNVVEIESGTNPFQGVLNNLEPYTTYYARAFASNSEGTGYGSVKTFKTLPGKASVAALGVYDIFRTHFTVSGSILAMNDSAVTAYGVVWDAESGFEPDHANVVAESGNFIEPKVFEIHVQHVPGPDTVWYRVFAQNSTGNAYSEEKYIDTQNNAPEINLDPDNSSGIAGIHYKGLAVEFRSGGVVADCDVLVSDLDGDTIQNVRFILSEKVYNDEEFLVYAGSNGLITVEGNNSDTLIIYNNGEVTNDIWTEIIREVEYRIEHHAPVASVVRQVKVMVTDGYDYSKTAIAYMSVLPVNDPPVCQVLPSINNEPVFGQRVNVVQGHWIDELDQCEGEMLYGYWWQIKIDDEITDIENAVNTYLDIDESMCGHQIRVVELVHDSYCGGSNHVTAIAESKWHTVSKAPQTVSFDAIPVQYFGQDPYLLIGSSSSGLPVEYSTGAHNLIEVLGNAVSFKTTGRAAITANQPGNVCYGNSGNLFRIITVEKGEQHIEQFSNQLFANEQLPVEALIRLSSGLEPQVSSSDESVFSIHNNTIHSTGTGQAFIYVSHPGNENYHPVLNQQFLITVNRGKQLLQIDNQAVLRVGDVFYPELILNSQLELSIESLDNEIVHIDQNGIIANMPGIAQISIKNEGNELWEPLDTLLILEIFKGIQRAELPDTVLVSYSDESFYVNSTASSTLPLTFMVENNSIATYTDNVFIIESAGESVIHAVQEGNDMWEPYGHTFILIVGKGSQNIELDNLPDATFGDEPFEINARASSKLEVLFDVLDHSIASVENNVLHIHGAGETKIVVEQQGNQNWNPVVYQASFVVNKAAQKIHSILPDTLSIGVTLSFSDFFATSNLPVDAIVSSDENIISVAGNSLIVISSGDVQLEVSQSGNNNILPASRLFSFYVERQTSLSKFENLSINIFPNPVTDAMHLVFNADALYPMEITVLSVTGRLVKSIVAEKPFNVIDMSNLEKGVYFVIVKNEKHYDISKVVVR